MKIIRLLNEIHGVDGEIGVEVEVEGIDLPHRINGWFTENDPSLRGEAAEYVLRKPATREEVDVYLRNLSKAYKDAGTVVFKSPRQSIHVHINVQDMEVKDLFNYILLVLIFETPLSMFCGKHRVGNLFCLNAMDAEALYSQLEDASTRDTFYRINTDELRYSFLNVASIFKYGSLEFRGMRGTDDIKLIKKWIDTLTTLKDSAVKFDNPVQIIEQLSRLQPDGFVKMVLGEHTTVVTKHKTWRQDLITAVRNVQSIAYRGDWKSFEGDK